MANTKNLRRGGPGRPKGSPNKSTRVVRDLAAKIVNDPQYRKHLLGRARRGELGPFMEACLWRYAGPPPKDDGSDTGCTLAALIVGDFQE
jgi:hypothetical protein